MSTGSTRGFDGYSWTDARVALLTKLWADGLSGAQIACELGGLTREAVCGKVFRLKLPARRTGSQNRPGRKPRGGGDLVRRKIENKFERQRNGEGVLIGRLPPEPAPPPVPPLHIGLADLNSEHCRWPFGDGPFSFCGHGKAGGYYCAYHQMVSTSRHA